MADEISEVYNNCFECSSENSKYMIVKHVKTTIFRRASADEILYACKEHLSKVVNKNPIGFKIQINLIDENKSLDTYLGEFNPVKTGLFKKRYIIHRGLVERPKIITVSDPTKGSISKTSLTYCSSARLPRL